MAMNTPDEGKWTEAIEKQTSKCCSLTATTEWLFIERSPCITIPTANPFVVIPATIIPKTIILIENKNVFL